MLNKWDMLKRAVEALERIAKALEDGNKIHETAYEDRWSWERRKLGLD